MYNLLTFKITNMDFITFDSFFHYLSIIATIAFIVQVGLVLMGGDIDSEVDDGVETHTSFFTIKNLIFFLTIFTWTVILCRTNQFGVISSILIGLLCGSTFIMLMSTMFFGISKLQHSGTMNLDSAIGKIGKVYLTIPVNSTGKIIVEVQGTERELDAILDNTINTELTTGSVVEVTNHFGGVLVVKPISK
jgi:hypothetical protein